MKRIVVRDSESGYIIDEVASVEEGEKLVREYEDDDRKDGTYTPGFYEVAEVEDGKVKTTDGEEICFEAAVAFMDDDIREDLHNKLAPCTEQEFFTAYEAEHLKKYGTEFRI